MCSYKTLSNSRDGYIILCNECGHFQIVFGTSAIKFEAELFHDFCIQVETLMQVHDCKGFYKQKNIHLDLYCTHIMFVLNYNELQKIAELLNQATFTLEMLTLLEQNNIA